MNNRLKFRMYDTNVNKMYMPNDFEEVESIYECIKQQINWDIDADYDIKFNHLEDGRFFMQCTGLKDKNGKLIYEGDIVKETLTDFINEEIITVVKWDKLNAMYNLENLQNCEREVIGNIYENKELLESEG